MKKRLFLALVVSAIAAVLIEALAWLVTPADIPAIEIPKSAENLYLSEEYYVHGYNYADSVYSPNNNDPQIGFLLSGRDIKTVFIVFKKPLPCDIAVQVYYASEGENLNETNHVDLIAKKDDRIIAALLPRDVYTQIRLDINGEFSLAGIYTDVEAPKTIYEKRPPHLERVLFSWVILTTLWACCEGDSTKSRVHFGVNGRYPERIIKFVPLFILCTMAVLVTLQVNNSSLACYSARIPNNVAEAGQMILGIPRAVRSDEYLVGTAAFFHNNLNGGLTEKVFIQDSNSIIVWINNIITLLNPFYWGELYLPVSYAFSWHFVFNSAFSIWIYYELFVILTGNKSFSIIASLLIVFSPAIQWWSIPICFSLLCAFIVCFYNFFQTKKTWKKLFYAWCLVCCTSALVQVIYPAWGIPLVYLFLTILIGVYLTKKKFEFVRKDIPYIIVTCSLMLCVIVAYLISFMDVSQSMMETVYPGSRFHAGGGLPDSYWAHYLAAPFITWKLKDIPMNQSEISHFLHLFPVPFAIFAAEYRSFKKNKVIVGLVFFNAICDIYMLFGIGDIIAEYTLLSYTIPQRLHIIWGLSSFILLLLECYYIVPKRLKGAGRADWIKCVFINSSIAAFLAWVAMNQKPLINYIEAGNFVYISTGVILLGNLLFWGKKRPFIAAMCVLTVISGVVVNPVNFGTSIMTGTPLAKEIRRIDQQDPGKWIMLDDWIMPKYVYAQGVDCLNYLSWPPRFDLFEPLDEDGEFRDIYNRYAHVTVSLTTEKTSFALNVTDSITVYLNVNDLQKWNVEYVMVHGELSEEIEDVRFELLYYDDLDHMNIYRAHY